MYLGIDLGTSNSAIVGSDGETLRLFKTVEGMDVMPSAIMVDRRGRLFVGRKAYDQSAFSPQSVQQKFKRLMGTSSKIEFPDTNKVMSPEEASAEVIKALVTQANRDVPDLVIEGAVITIPAAFNQMQSEATMRAAQLAGLGNVALLQEPIAASMAAIADTPTGSGQFLIYDLGGGTFDAAIVQNISGNVTVVAHAGVNMLGGSDFDRAIVNSIVRSWLLENFSLPENFQTQREFARLIRIAHYRAEMCKIALSAQEFDQVFADENQIGTKDTDGRDIYLDVEVSRVDLEALIAENVDRSIAECRTLLSHSGYSPADIDRITLIGGPSRMPYIRERVGFELGIGVDTKVDPMTAVATGAAIYASGRNWESEGVASPRTARRTKTTASDLQLEFEYVDYSASSEIRIRVKTSISPVPEGISLQVDAANGWTSGKVPLADKVDIKGVPLPRIGKNEVKVSVFDANGTINSNASTLFEINRLAATSDGMPLMHNLGIRVVSGSPGTKHDVLKTIIKKGVSTPTRGMEALRASRDLRAGSTAALVFELFEQDDGVNDPLLNLAIGTFELKGDDLTPGQIIRKGDSVHVHWNIDANSLLHCHFVLPDTGLEYSLVNMYVPTESASNFDGEDGAQLARRSLASARKDLEQLEHALGNRVGAKSDEYRERLDDLDKELSKLDDSDIKRRVTEDARFLRQEIYRLKHDPKNTALVQQAELDAFSNDYAQYFTREVDAETNTNILRQIDSARDALRDGNLEENRQAMNEAQALLNNFMLKQPGFWLAQFNFLIEERLNAADKSLHDRLAVRGQRAINDKDTDELRLIVVEMMQNLIRTSEGSNVAILSGLMV